MADIFKMAAIEDYLSHIIILNFTALTDVLIFGVNVYV